MSTLFVHLSLVLILAMPAMALELHYDRVELLNASYVEGYYNVSQFQVNKFNRTTYVFNAAGEIFIDIDRTVTASMDLWYNRFNNNQYSKSPMRVPKSSLCDALDKYSGLLSEVLRKSTNMLDGKKPGDKVCPLKKVNCVLRLISYVWWTFLNSSATITTFHFVISTAGSLLGKEFCIRFD